MYPNFEHAKIGGRPATEVITDRAWLEGGFLKTVQQRGKEVIDARGKSSAASAANAVVNHLQSMLRPTPEGDCFSGAVYAAGNPYGVPGDLMFSFPLRNTGSSVEIVQGLELSNYARQKLAVTTDELREEREAVADLLA